MRKIIGSILLLSMLIVFVPVNVLASEKTLDSAVEDVLGTPYLWGGTTTKGFDCSGFIQYVFKKLDVTLPRTTKSQAKEGTKVEQEDLRTGDLVFFNTDGTGISHAGIYMGDGQFSHSSASKGVQISKLSEKYYVERYVTARRILSDDDFKRIIGD